jgi:hypothetical protein
MGRGKVPSLIFLLVAIALATVLVHTQAANASTSYEDGFKQGAKDAGRDLQGKNGHGFDDSCPKGHTATFCEGYQQGYSERFHDTPENDK